MYLPSDMNFQYFFFDTYFGYFLQVLPIAVLVTLIYWFIKYRNDKVTSKRIKIFSCLFVCYITGLICLVALKDIISNIWYMAIYHMDPGSSIILFNFSVNLVPNFWNHINEEVIGNFLMFLPFGILYPLSQEKTILKNTIKTGIILVLSIEIFQFIFGRAFDINDVILNSLGIILSTIVFNNIIKKNS